MTSRPSRLAPPLLVCLAALSLARPSSANTAYSNSFTLDLRGPNSLGLSFGAFSVGNLSTKASRFNLWLQVTRAGGLDIDESAFSFRVVSAGGAELARMVEPPVQVASETRAGATVETWRVGFEIVRRDPATGAPGFAGGRLEVRRTPGGAPDTLAATDFDLAVWGTDFDMATDAFPFYNGKWAGGDGLSNDQINAAWVIRPYLALVEGADFWRSVGWGPLTRAKGKSVGLCYGMAASSIARFVNRGDRDYWGEKCPGGASYCEWKSPSDNSWRSAIVRRDLELDAGKPMWDSPFPTTADLAKSGGSYDVVGLEAFKKILYYHVAQRAYQESFTGHDTWVGNDRLTDGFSLPAATSLLAANRPVLFPFWFQAGASALAGHAIVLAQVARLKSTVAFLFYDNRFPLKSGTDAAFLRATVKDADPLTLRDAIIETQTKTGQWLDSKDLYTVKEAAVLPWGAGDSQWIYGIPRPSAARAAVAVAGSVAPTDLTDAERQRLLELSYARIVLVGAESFQVFDEGSTAPLEVVSGANLDGSALVFDAVPDGFLTTLYLPVPTPARYRVEVVKRPESPVLMIYEDVPAGGDSLDAIGYEALAAASNDRTRVSLLVGRENTDHAAARTSATGVTDTVPPTFAELATLAVPAVQGLEAVRVAGTVHLTWKNPVHTGFTGTALVRTQGGPATAKAGGVLIYQGSASSANDTPPAPGAYFYTAFSLDSSSMEAASTWTSIDITRPCITGRVLADGSAVEGAAINVIGEDGVALGASSSADGTFAICGLPPGRYTITCERSGVQLESASQTVLLGDENAAVPFQGAVIPTLTLTSPVGGERWVIGTTQYIGWSSTGGIPTVKVEISRDAGSTWATLAGSAENDGAAVFTVTGPVSSRCLIRVSAAGGQPGAMGEAVFSIVENRSAGVSRRLRRR